MIVVSLLVLAPSLCSSGDFTRYVSPESVVENRAGITVSVKRTALSIRLERFARAHGAPADQAPIMAELLAACEHPRLMAATAARESGFDINAVGAAGEVGAYQVKPSDWGHPGKTFPAQTQKTSGIYRDLLSAAGGRVRVAAAMYNGGFGWRSPKAQQYAAGIDRLIRSI